MNLQDVLKKCEKTGSWYGEKIETLNQRNFMGDTPLHTVCSWGELEPVKIVLQSGADINASGDRGSTPIFNAIIGRNPEVVRFLIENGAQPSIRNEIGWTPLQYAKNVGAGAEIVKLLAKK